MTTNLQLDRFGGRFNHNLGQLLLTADMNRMGDLAIQSLVHLLGLLFYDAANEVPQTGLASFEGADDFCRVTMTGDLSFAVAPGWGLAFDASRIGTNDWGVAAYRPVVIETQLTGSLEANIATEPRIDVISAAPRWAEDQVSNRNVKDPTTGARHVNAMPLRHRFSGQVVVTKGTPSATPSVPATPTGHIKLAEVFVPASSGAATVADHRPILTMARGLRPSPGEDHVVEGLEPTMVGVTGAEVGSGIAEIRGRRIRYAATGEMQPTHNAGAPSRYDLLVARDDGIIELVEGTTTQPTQGDAPAGSLLVGIVVVKGASSGVQAVLDRRELGSVGPAQLRRGAVVEAIEDAELPGAKLEAGGVTTAKIAADARPVYIALDVEPVAAGNPRKIGIQIVDANGDPVAKVAKVLCSLRSNQWSTPPTGGAHSISKTGPGTALSGIGAGVYDVLVQTDAFGKSEITVTPAASADTVHLSASLYDAAGGGGHATWTT